MKKKTKDKTFAEWIDHIGVDKLAKTLQVHTATIKAWRSGRCDPRVDHMRRMKKLSNGTMDYVQMIDRPVLASRVSRHFEER